jgi:hypothetical protein
LALAAHDARGVVLVQVLDFIPFAIDGGDAIADPIRRRDGMPNRNPVASTWLPLTTAGWPWGGRDKR